MIKTLPIEGCKAISKFLFVEGASNNLSKNGACELACDLLREFCTRDAFLAQKLCFIIASLAFSPENRQIFARLGACELVVKALEKFGTIDQEVAYKGCGAVAKIALLDENNQAEFRRIGGCEVIG